MIDFNKIHCADLPDLKKANLMNLPKTYLCLEDWNELMTYLNKLHKDGRIKQGFPRTKSGGVSVKNIDLIRCSYMIDVNYMKDGAVKDIQCYTFVPCDYRDDYHNLNCKFILANETNYEPKTKVTGTTAYKAFTRELKKDGIDLLDYTITNGKEIKETIPKPLIMLAAAEENEIYANVHHLDIHSSYPSAMIEQFPEWEKTIQRIYDGRKQHPEYKLILNASYGYFQSAGCRSKELIDGHARGYALAHVSKHCIERNNEKIFDMRDQLIERGCMVLAYNTDGIWFQGPSQTEYVGEKRLGHFEEDHSNCTIRFKSKGVYEFMEGDIYTPVVRGLTKLDKTTPRTNWVWGDIYNEDAHIIEYRTNIRLGYGIVEEFDIEEK